MNNKIFSDIISGIGAIYIILIGIIFFYAGFSTVKESNDTKNALKGVLIMILSILLPYLALKY